MKKSGYGCLMARIFSKMTLMRFSAFFGMFVICISMLRMGVFASEVPIGEMVESDNGGVVSGEASAPVVTGSDAALLSEINAQLADITTPSLLNVNSTQLNYFKSYLASRPFVDYVVTYDGEQDYVLYYGYDFEGAVDYVRIYRVSSGGYNYNYVVTTGTASVPSSNIYIDTRKDVNAFVEIEQLKQQTMLCILVAVLVGLWVLSKILFR